MLTSLSLKNIATVSDTTFELGPGLNVLTGETGSGKSVLIEGLLLALGERADRSLVRPGARVASVEAVFSRGDSEILVRREILKAGRSRMFIDDELVTLDDARETISDLVDLHTQRSTPALLHRKKQTQSLDRFAGCTDFSGELRRLFDGYSGMLSRRQELAGVLEESSRNRELLEHEQDLIDSLDPSLEDYSGLTNERKQLEVLDREAHVFSLIHEGLEGESGITDLLGELLGESGKLDQTSGELIELLTQARISLREAADICSARLSGVDSAPWRLEKIDERLDRYARLLSRCGGDIDALLSRREYLSDELHRLEALEQEFTGLEKDIPLLCGELLDTARRLTEIRTRAATELTEAVTSELRLLGIPDAVFEVSMGTPPPERSMNLEGVLLCSDGAEVPEFLFSANPGLAPARLSSVASGGEMSRISLALRLALSSSADISTMVFDEIDTGIGGETAHVLADSLFRASDSGRQLIVITHLAIVASRASTHLAVSKSTDSGSSVTEVTALSGSGRIKELTRILGGGEAARDHALDLLSQPEKI